PASRRERVEEIDPHALRSPADIAVVEGLPWPILRRCVDPAPAGFQHVNDAADHPPVIDPGLPARIGGEMWRNLRKLGVGQPKTVGNHRRFLSEAVNHDTALTPTILWCPSPSAREWDHYRVKRCRCWNDKRGRLQGPVRV